MRKGFLREPYKFSSSSDDTFQKESRLVNKNWADYNMANLVFRPARVIGRVLEKKLACCILACPDC